VLLDHNSRPVDQVESFFSGDLSTSCPYLATQVRGVVPQPFLLFTSHRFVFAKISATSAMPKYEVQRSTENSLCL